MQRGLAAHRDETRRWMKTAAHIDFIEIDYPSLIADPKSAVRRIIGFLGPDRLPTANSMISAVDVSLYRRKGNGKAAQAFLRQDESFSDLAERDPLGLAC